MKVKTIVAALAVAAAAAPAYGHHSSAMFDQTKVETLSGTVKEFLWTNPHSYIQLMVKNDHGGEDEWNLEMTAPLHLQRLGWTKSSLKAGDHVTVKIHPLRDGSHGGNVQEAIGPDGKQIGKPA